MTAILRSRRRNHLDTLVCAVATHRTPGLRLLEKSCRRFGIGLTLLGWGERYESHTWKLLTQRSAYRELADDYRYVLAVDAFDSLFIAGLDEVMAKFLALDTPILISAEANCWPPWGPSPQDYPPAPTRYQYVNAGGYVGEMRAVLELLERFEQPGYADWWDDQGFWAKVYVSGEPRLKLDHGNQVFQSLMKAEEDLEPGSRVRNRATGSFPCILHANGGSADLHPYYRMLPGHRDRRDRRDREAKALGRRSP